MGGNGVYLPTAPIYAGEHIYKANPKIIEALGAVGRLWAHQPIKHSYPHCWRHKTLLFSVLHHNGSLAWIKKGYVKVRLMPLKMISSLYRTGVRTVLNQ